MAKETWSNCRCLIGDDETSYSSNEGGVGRCCSPRRRHPRTIKRMVLPVAFAIAIAMGGAISLADAPTLSFEDVCESGTPEQITALIKAGADVNAKDNYAWTPLMYAAMNPRPEVIAALVKAGADVNAKSKDGETPLMIAAAKNSNLDVIAAMVKAGADVNARTTLARGR